MFSFIMKLFRCLCQPVVVQKNSGQQQKDPHGVPPRYITIESAHEGSVISGLLELVGEMAKVIQTLEGERITGERSNVIRGDCGHMIFSVNESDTDTGNAKLAVQAESRPDSILRDWAIGVAKVYRPHLGCQKTSKTVTIGRRTSISGSCSVVSVDD